MRSLLDRPLIITIGKDQSSSVSGCDLPKFDPWGEEIVKFVDHMWVVGSDNLIICLSSLLSRPSAAPHKRPCSGWSSTNCWWITGCWTCSSSAETKSTVTTNTSRELMMIVTPLKRKVIGSISWYLYCSAGDPDDRLRGGIESTLCLPVCRRTGARSTV